MDGKNALRDSTSLFIERDQILCIWNTSNTYESNNNKNHFQFQVRKCDFTVTKNIPFRHILDANCIC